MNQDGKKDWSGTHARIRAELFISSLTFAMLTNFPAESIRFPFNVITFTDEAYSKIYIFQIGALFLSLYFLTAIWHKTQLERDDIVPLRDQVGARIKELTALVRESVNAVKSTEEVSVLTQQLSESLRDQFSQLFQDTSNAKHDLQEIRTTVSDIKLRLDQLPTSSEAIIKDLKKYEKTLGDREGHQHGLAHVGDFLTLAERIDTVLEQIGSFAEEEIQRSESERSLDVEAIKAGLSAPMSVLVERLDGATSTLNRLPSELASTQKVIKNLLKPQTRMERYTKRYLDWISAGVPMGVSVIIIVIGLSGWVPEEVKNSVLIGMFGAK